MYFKLNAKPEICYVSEEDGSFFLLVNNVSLLSNWFQKHLNKVIYRVVTENAHNRTKGQSFLWYIISQKLEDKIAYFL